MKKRAAYIKLSFLCLFSVIANILLSHLVEGVLKLPLFMDTLFTVAMSFAAGPLWGSLTAVLTTALIGIIFSYQHWGIYLYALCSVTAAILTWLFCGNPGPLSAGTGETFGRGDPFFTVPVVTRLFVLSIVMCLAISVLGGLIAFIISVPLRGPEYDMPPEFFFRLGLLGQNIPLLAANILSRIPVNIVDRLLSVFGAYGISLLYRKAARLYG
jgi:hypothetical protein